MNLQRGISLSVVRTINHLISFKIVTVLYQIFEFLKREHDAKKGQN